MKRHLILYALIGLIAVCLVQGCKQTAEETLSPELAQAEAVMFEHPDSALHILETMQKPDASNEEQHALWCLLVTQAQYKQSFTFHSDSLIRIAYEYYRPTDNSRRKALSALYMGNVNYELKHITEAMDYFLEAKAEMEKTDDYKLGYLVMSSLGNLYVYRDLTDYALEAFREAYTYAVKDSCKRYEISSLQDLGRAYAVNEDYERAIDMYTQAIQIRDCAHITFRSLESELADIYSMLGEYEKALFLEKQGITDDSISAQNYYSIGGIFLNLEKYDSAYYYLKKALNTTNVYTLAGAYDALMYLSHQPAYRKYMADFCDSLLFYQDSVYALDKSETIIAYREKYNHQKLINKNQRLTYQTTRLFLLSIIAMLCLTGVIIYFYLYRKTMIRRKNAELNRLISQLNENKRLIAQNNTYIAELERRMAENQEAAEQMEELQETLALLRKENQIIHQKNEQLQDEISTYKSTRKTTSKTEELNQLKSHRDQLSTLVLETHPYLTALHQKPICLTDKERSHICQLTNTIYAGFDKRLLAAVPTLSEYEVLLCSLIKLHFSVSEIATLLSISPASVSTSKSRLKKKIYTHLGISSEKKSFDNWIWEF